MRNTNSNPTQTKNKLYISIISLAIILVLVAIFASNSKSCSKSATSKETISETVHAVSVVSESGAQQETIKANIGVRDISFAQKISKIKKYEKSQSDTADNPSVAKSEDGYTYLTYKYNTENAPEFFGTKVSATDASAMLVYVFYNKKLIEVRIQYGNIGENGYNSIVSNLNSTYGNATYSRSYSNGAKESWWKTEDVILDVIYQDSGVIAYYRANNN